MRSTYGKIGAELPGSPRRPHSYSKNKLTINLNSQIVRAQPARSTTAWDVPDGPAV